MQSQEAEQIRYALSATLHMLVAGLQHHPDMVEEIKSLVRDEDLLHGILAESDKGVLVT